MRWVILSVLMSMVACSSSEDGSGSRAEPIESAETAELVFQIQLEIAERVEAGESFETIANGLRAREGVVDAAAENDALMFIPDGGTPRFWYRAETAIDPADLQLPPTGSGLRIAPDSSGLVARESPSITSKRALLLEPFAFQFGTELGRWASELQQYHDYREGVVRLDANESVGAEDFADWSDYRLIIISTHGTRVSGQTVLFSSQLCGLSAWLQSEVEAGRGNLATQAAGQSIADLRGVNIATAYNALSSEQRAEFDAFRAAENTRFTAAGQACQTMTVPRAGIIGGPALGSGTFQFIGYNATFLRNNRSNIRQALLWLSACQSDALPSNLFDSDSAYFGWDDRVSIRGDQEAQEVGLDMLITQGRLADDTIQQLFEDQKTPVTWTDRNNASVTAALLSLGSGRIRVREIVSLLPRDSDRPYSTVGDRIEPTATEPDGRLLLEMSVRVDGITEGQRNDARVWIEDATGNVLFGPVDAPSPGPNSSGRLDVSLRVPDASSVELIAKVQLPEEPPGQVSMHRVLLEVGEATEPLWSLQFDGRRVEGESINAPLARAIEDSEGELQWNLILSGGDGVVNVQVFGHPGRPPDCQGEIGSFPVAIGLALQDGSDVSYVGRPIPADDCAATMSMNITSFSKEEDFIATFDGGLCKGENVDGEIRVSEVPASGTFRWPAAGCGSGPVGDDLLDGFVGSYRTDDEPGVCTDIYANSALAASLEQVCAMASDLTCDLENICPRDGLIGSCDYRGEGVEALFRGTIINYGSIDANADDLQFGCELTNGIWVPGS